METKQKQRLVIGFFVFFWGGFIIFQRPPGGWGTSGWIVIFLCIVALIPTYYGFLKVLSQYDK